MIAFTNVIFISKTDKKVLILVKLIPTRNFSSVGLFDENKADYYFFFKSQYVKYNGKILLPICKALFAVELRPSFLKRKFFAINSL